MGRPPADVGSQGPASREPPEAGTAAPIDGGSDGDVGGGVRNLRAEKRVAMALSVVVLGVSVAYLVGAVDLNQGSLQRPGVGFFPLIVAVGLLVAAVVDVVQTARRPAVTDGEPDDDDRSPGDQQFGEAAWRVPVLLGLLVAYFVALPVVGHLAAAAVMCSVVVRMLSAWRWWVSILAGIGVAVGSVLVFEVLLGMRLPG